MKTREEAKESLKQLEEHTKKTPLTPACTDEFKAFELAMYDRVVNFCKLVMQA